MLQFHMRQFPSYNRLVWYRFQADGQDHHWDLRHHSFHPRYTHLPALVLTPPYLVIHPFNAPPHNQVSLTHSAYTSCGTPIPSPLPGSHSAPSLSSSPFSQGREFVFTTFWMVRGVLAIAGRASCGYVRVFYPVMSITEAPPLLGRICSSWRKVYLSTPPLWCAIHLVVPSFYNPSMIADTIQLQCVALKEWLESRSVGYDAPLNFTHHTKEWQS